MTNGGTEMNRAQVMRVIHLALVTGVLLFGAIAVYVVQISGDDLMLGGDAGRAIVLVAYGLAVAIFLLTKVLRNRIVAPRPGTDLDEWWAENQAWAIALWAVAEGGALAGLVFYMVTANWTVLALPGGLGLLILLVTRPAALAGR